LRSPITWLAVAAAAVMGSIMTFSYIGGFLDPVGHLHDAPIAIVNADKGAQAAGTTLDAGKQLEQQLTGSGGGKVDWRKLDTAAEARAQLRDNRLWGAIVIPEDFSSSIARIGTSLGQAPPAQLDILTNEGSGLFQSSFVEQLTATALAETSDQTNQQLVALLGQANATIAPSAAVTLGRPVVAETKAVVELPAKAGRGIAPFYLAVMVTLTGFLAASIVGIGIDLLRGTERLELFGRDLDLGRITRGGPWSQWTVKAIGTSVGAALGGLLAVGTAVGILGMDVASAPKAYGMGVLGAVAIGLVSLVFLTLFGLAGELLGVLFTTIFGVPSALGVYPAQTVPGVFRFIAAWHPMRYLTDAMRSIAFFDATGAGLGRAVVVITIWLVGALVVGALAARLIDRSAPAS
jgi:YhgE/Pip-like protein